MTKQNSLMDPNQDSSAINNNRRDSSRDIKDAEINKYFDRHQKAGGSPKLNDKFLGDSDRFLLGRGENQDNDSPHSALHKPRNGWLSPSRMMQTSGTANSALLRKGSEQSPDSSSIAAP